jgi:high-affinity nickel-transport protein
MNPSELPHDVLAVAIVALLLGAKHGCDADHLAAIDGLVRFNARESPRLARAAGALFSLGHGAAVLAVALAVATMASRWQAPAWLAELGAWISIGLLALLGVANLVAVARAREDQLVRVSGLRSTLLAGLLRRSSPVGIALVGALFALSFDTFSLASLLALSGASFGGWGSAALLALVFAAGMVAIDGINGLWIARLIRRSDATARVASRVMGLAVASVSLLVAGLGAARQLWPAAGAWAEGKEQLVGLAVVAMLLAAFGLGQWMARQRTAARVG